MRLNESGNWLNEIGKKIGEKAGDSDTDGPILNPRRQIIMLEIKQNPYVTKQELSEIIGISTMGILMQEDSIYY